MSAASALVEERLPRLESKVSDVAPWIGRNTYETCFKQARFCDFPNVLTGSAIKLVFRLRHISADADAYSLTSFKLGD